MKRKTWLGVSVSILAVVGLCIALQRNGPDRADDEREALRDAAETEGSSTRAIPGGNATGVARSSSKGRPGAARSSSTANEAPGLSIQGFIQDEGGRAVPWCLVEVGMLTEEGEFVPAPGVRFRTRLDGWFVLHPDPGMVRIRVSADGYAMHLSDPIAIGPDSPVAEFLITLVKGASIAGRIQDTDLAPVSGATVRCQRLGDGSTRYLHPAESDPTGAFRVQGLTPGAYAVTVRQPDFAESMKMPVADGTSDLVFTLEKLSGIAGRVLDEEGLVPVTEFRISVQLAVDSYDRPDPRSTAIESEDGTFSIIGLEPGAYSVAALAEGFAVANLEALEVAPGQVTEDVEIVVRRGGSLTGRVLAPDEVSPVAGAWVFSLRDLPPQEWRGESLLEVAPEGAFRAVTDAEGRFEFENLSAGIHSILAEHPDFAPAWRDGVVIEADREGREILLVLTEPGGIRGHVFGENRRGIRGAFVSVFPMGLDQMNRQYQLADRSGYFEFPRLAPGPYYVAMAPSDDDPTYSGSRVTNATVSAGRFTSVDFTVHPPGFRLYGTVSSQDGSPRARYTVSVFNVDRFGGDGDAGSVLSGTTDEKGSYEIPGMQPGTWIVYVTEGFSKSFSQHSILGVRESETERRLDIRLSGSTLEGRVASLQDGSPIAGVNVLLESHVPFFGHSMIAARATTSAGGRYVLRDIPPGIYQLVAGAPGYGQEILEGLTVGEGQAIDGLDFRLGRGGDLLVEVRDAAGAPMTGIFVLVFDPRGVQVNDSTKMAATDAKGRLRVLGLKPGDYRAVAYRTLSDSVAADAIVRAGQETALRIEFPKP